MSFLCTDQICPKISLSSAGGSGQSKRICTKSKRNATFGRNRCFSGLCLRSCLHPIYYIFTRLLVQNIVILRGFSIPPSLIFILYTRFAQRGSQQSATVRFQDHRVVQILRKCVRLHVPLIIQTPFGVFNLQCAVHIVRI